MTGSEYIRKAMSHARTIGNMAARRMGVNDKREFVRKFTKLLRHIVERQAKEWSGLPDRSERMKESLRDMESDARK